MMHLIIGTDKYAGRHQHGAATALTNNLEICLLIQTKP
jgi:hypothetical protein